MHVVGTAVVEHVLKPVVPEKYLDEQTIFHLNPSGELLFCYVNCYVTCYVTRTSWDQASGAGEVP
jgi:S-adenosylmethionine synthetase